MQFIEPEYQRAQESTEKTSAITGFQSPADDYRCKKLDLNQYFIRSPHSTFFIWVDNTDIQGIEVGDLLIINRARKRKDGDIAVIYRNGEYGLRILEHRGDAWFLYADKSDTREFADSETICWGIVDAVIRRCWP